MVTRYAEGLPRRSRLPMADCRHRRRAVAGAFAGHSDGVAEAGGQPLPTWSGLVAALILALASMASISA